MNFSTGATRNGGPPSDLTEEDLEDLRIELSKVLSLSRMFML